MAKTVPVSKSTEGEEYLQTPNYLAELLVAGRFADGGWNVYFPHRDHGFDFIIVKPSSDGKAPLMRPVQVKGKYASPEKTDKAVYGFVGKLSQIHPDMVLAIPYFPAGDREAPVHIAYMPCGTIKSHSRGVHCEPAQFSGGRPVPRPGFARYFDAPGLAAVSNECWE